MSYTRKFLPLMVMLLLAGAGCPSSSPRSAIRPGTRAMMPADVPIMKGLEPRDESAWRVLPGEEGKSRLESRWSIDAPYDKVVAWYLDAFDHRGLSTHTIEKDGGIRIFWGTSEQAYYADLKTNGSIYVHEEKVDGKTPVEMELDLPAK